MPPEVISDVDRVTVVFERPRHLGRGFEVFDTDYIPVTPSGSFLQPDECPSKLSIDETFSIDFKKSDSGHVAMDSFTSRVDSETSTQTEYPDGSFDFSARRSFCFGETLLRHQIHRILVLGMPGLLCTHVAKKILRNGHYVRLLERNYRGKGPRHLLSNLVKTRPSRLSLFDEDDLFFAVADCDGIVYIDGPDTSDLCDEREIEDRFVTSIRDLFISIRMNGKRVKRVVFISSASTMFPIETSLLPKTQNLKRAQELSLKEAERFAGKINVPLTVILPSVVVGPSLLGECDGNVQALVNFAKQRRCVTSPMFYNIVDVRDVAEVCAVSLTSPWAEHQKYILSAGEMSLVQIASVMNACIPSVSPPVRQLPTFLAKTFLYFGILSMAGFEFYEQGTWKQIGLSYPLSSKKVQHDFPIKLRSAPEAVVAAVAKKMNVQAVMPQSNITDIKIPPRRSYDDQHEEWRKVFIVGLCSVFGVVGYFTGKCMFGPKHVA